MTQESIPFLDLGAMTDEVREAVDTAWKDVTTTNAFIGGAHVERFEQEWAEQLGRTHVVGVANGTDALELALRGLGLRPGAEVIVPANTFIATAEAVVAAGGVPRFVDVDPASLLLDAATLEAAITSRTEAVIPVHLYGQPVDMDAVMAVAERHDLAVVEDAAQAHGASWRGRPAGSFGHAACHSFYPGKNLGAFGDGGSVATDDAALANRIRSLSNHGRSATSAQVHDVLGRNSRLDGLQAAVLSAKLPRLSAWTEGRRRAADSYRSALAGGPVQLVEEAEGAIGSYHLFVVRAADRDDLRAALGERGIATGIHYQTPCHLQEPFAPFATGPLPVAEQAADQILSLPMFPHLSDDQVATVVEAVRELASPPGELRRAG